MADEEFAGADWIDDHWEQLLAERRYNHEWVAVNAQEIVAHDPQIDRVIAQVRDLRIDPDELTFTYLNYDVRVRLP